MDDILRSHSLVETIKETIASIPHQLAD
jgi:hypothetical protein